MLCCVVFIGMSFLCVQVADYLADEARLSRVAGYLLDHLLQHGVQNCEIEEVRSLMLQSVACWRAHIGQQQATLLADVIRVYRGPGTRGASILNSPAVLSSVADARECASPHNARCFPTHRSPRMTEPPTL